MSYSPASSDDVADRWRPLSDAEQVTVETWLDDAWNKLLILIPGIDTRVETDDVLEANTIATLAHAVIRFAQNPEGFRQRSVSIDDASRAWTIDSSRSTGMLQFTAEELNLLGAGGYGRGRIFSVMPS